MSNPAPRDATIVLLVYDEIDGLKQLWDQIPIDQFVETICIDGGSTDGSREFLHDRGIPVFDQPIAGRGVAFRVAADVAKGSRLIFYSPDGNEDPADISKLDDLLLDGARLAIAARFGPGARNEEDDELIRARARVNQALTWLANRLFNTGPWVYDTINGFRAFHKVDLLELDTTVKRFPIEYQTSLRAMARGWPIVELPTQELPRAGGESKCLSWPVGKDHLKVLFTELPNSRFLRPKAFYC